MKYRYLTDIRSALEFTFYPPKKHTPDLVHFPCWMINEIDLPHFGAIFGNKIGPSFGLLLKQFPLHISLISKWILSVQNGTRLETSESSVVGSKDRKDAYIRKLPHASGD